MRRTAVGFEFTDHSIKVMMFIGSLVLATFTLGVSWATATNALAGKADASDVRIIQSRLLVDSLRDDSRTAQLRRMEEKLDSVSVRITQIACPVTARACR